jgi:hypothetical protein
VTNHINSGQNVLQAVGQPHIFITIWHAADITTSNKNTA